MVAFFYMYTKCNKICIFLFENNRLFQPFCQKTTNAKKYRVIQIRMHAQVETIFQVKMNVAQ